MLRLLTYLIGNGVATNRKFPESLDQGTLGLPLVTAAPCDNACNECVQACPTDAISLAERNITVDRGACIACGLCTNLCPTGTIENDLSTATFEYGRDDLRISANRSVKQIDNGTGIFARSLSIRVVSTGCAACDLEVAAANNPLFDLERFGVNIVASPRFADALLVTGPVPKAMHEPLLSCYQAMADPKIVIACGTCATSGGVHRNTYACADGVPPLLPVDVFVPGCPPHPWQIIQAILAAQKLDGKRNLCV